jgi:hypothetical protein
LVGKERVILSNTDEAQPKYAQQTSDDQTIFDVTVE